MATDHGAVSSLAHIFGKILALIVVLMVANSAVLFMIDKINDLWACL